MLTTTSSRFSSKSEADALELLENLEEMFPLTTWIVMLERLSLSRLVASYCEVKYLNL